MLAYRRVDTSVNRDVVLDLHCRSNYACETPYARTVPYASYKAMWLGTPQPVSFLAQLDATMRDPRTLAEVLIDDDVVVGYLWVTFTDLDGYDVTVAEIMDLAVIPERQRQGLGTQMMDHIETETRARGATLLRSDTGMDNIASQTLHEHAGFTPYHIKYEKVLQRSDDASRQ